VNTVAKLQFASKQQFFRKGNGGERLGGKPNFNQDK
jgi:hypothetical protein